MYQLKRQYIPEGHEQHDVLYVEGVGHIEVAPDTAIITMAVTTEGISPLETEIANDTKVINYTKNLEGFGIKDENILEAKSTIKPLVDENGNTYYTGTTFLNVYLYDLELLREYLYNAENAGLEPIRVNFSLKDPEGYYNDALEKAVINGIEKARKIGETLNSYVDLNPLTIVETSSSVKLLDDIVSEDELSTINYGYFDIVATVREEFKMER